MTKRQIFFSFHYGADSWRASQIRNMGVVSGESTFSDNDWEKVKRKDEESIKLWIDSQLQKRSCTIVLIGEGTANRKWINYEIKRSLEMKKGIFGIYIHNLKDHNKNKSSKGNNPFDYVYYSSWFGIYTLDTFFGRVIHDFVNSTQMSCKIPCYESKLNDSQKVYNKISENIQNYIEKAIEQANRDYDL